MVCIPTLSVLCILIWKSIWRYNNIKYVVYFWLRNLLYLHYSDIYFFDILFFLGTPKPRCFVFFLFGNIFYAIMAYNFFIFYLANWLRTRRFSEPTFQPSGILKLLEKYNISRFSYLFVYLIFIFFFSDFLFIFIFL